jgi:hypothetical protein
MFAKLAAPFSDPAGSVVLLSYNSPQHPNAVLEYRCAQGILWAPNALNGWQEPCNHDFQHWAAGTSVLMCSHICACPAAGVQDRRTHPLRLTTSTTCMHAICLSWSAPIHMLVMPAAATLQVQNSWARPEGACRNPMRLLVCKLKSTSLRCVIANAYCTHPLLDQHNAISVLYAPENVCCTTANCLSLKLGPN